MPRREARIDTSIWRDKDFLALPGSAQRLYLLLLSQSDLSLCGVISYTPNRWAKMCSDDTVECMVASLAILDEKRFTVTDVQSEELFVRSLMRRDNVKPGNPKVWKPAMDQAAMVISERVRAAIAAEVERIMRECANPQPNAPSEPPSDAPSDGGSEGGEDDEAMGLRAHARASAYRLPPTAPHQPPPEKPSSPSAPRLTDANFQRFYDAYPRKAGPRKAREALAKALARKADLEAIIAAAARLRDDPNREQQFTPFPATWLNRDGWLEGPLPSRNGSRPMPNGRAAGLPPRFERPPEFT